MSRSDLPGLSVLASVRRRAAVVCGLGAIAVGGMAVVGVVAVEAPLARAHPAMAAGLRQSVTAATIGPPRWGSGSASGAGRPQSTAVATVARGPTKPPRIVLLPPSRVVANRAAAAQVIAERANAARVKETPQSGILPPNDPSSNAPGWGPCTVASDLNNQSADCTNKALTAITTQQATEGGVTPMALPSNWYTLTPAEQLFVATNLERIDRGLPPMLGLVSCLDTDAYNGATAGHDPLYDKCLGSANLAYSIWLGGEPNALGADWAWMYDDGCPGPNDQCQLNPPAEWGHRDAILQDVTGWGTCVEGAGSAVPTTTSYTVLFVCLPSSDPTPAMYFTWANNVVPYLGTAPVAPNFTLSVSPAARRVQAGTAANFALTLTAQNGYDQTVSMSGSVPNMPVVDGQGTIGYSAATVSLDNNTAADTLTAASDTPAGTYDVAITALGADGTEQTAAVTVTVTASGTTTTTTPPTTTTTVPGSSAGYWMVDSGGQVFPFGSAGSFGSPGTAIGPSVGLAALPGGSGYWVAGSSGQVAGFGNAGSYQLSGSPTGAVVTIASTADGKGYWVATASGQVLTAGDAVNYGSPMAQGLHLNGPIVDMAPTAGGAGYWLLGSDGGVFTFGDAPFYGSTGNLHLNAPAVAMTPTPDGKGYWFVASDGGIFTFGDAQFYGSMGAVRLNKPVNGMVATGDGAGYWLVASDGGVFTFGDAGFVGSLGGNPPASPVVGFAPS